jgi:hypothetical protein
MRGPNTAGRLLDLTVYLEVNDSHRISSTVSLMRLKGLATQSAARLQMSRERVSNVSKSYLLESQTNGAGDEARTRNFQLGNVNFRSFNFNTYKIA